MAGTTTESTNKASQVESGNENVPAAQSVTETKASDAAGDLPPITKEPLSTAEAHMVPSSAAESKPGTTTTAPIPVPEPATAPSEVNDSVSDVKKKMAEAENLAAQPEKPSDSALNPDAQPVNVEKATPATIPNGEPSKQPKPVTVEEVQDRDMPLAKPAVNIQDASSKEPVTDTPASAANDGSKDEQMMGTSEPADDVPPVVFEAEKTELVTGSKRKADALDAADDDITETVPEKVVETSKKQKTNGASSNGTAKKPGRPKKEKKQVAPVGRTARKTRSQGAAE